MVVTLSSPVIVTATATIFMPMSQTIILTYDPVATNLTVVAARERAPPPPMTAQLFLSANHDLGPFQTTTAPPGLCQATLTWTVTPISLSGTTGMTTPVRYRNRESDSNVAADAASGLNTTMSVWADRREPTDRHIVSFG